MVEEVSSIKIRKIKNSKKDFIFAVGRRREAIARVRLYTSTSNKVEINGNEYVKGDVIVNGKPINEYFRFVGYKPEYNKILRDTDAETKFVISAKVVGGGMKGQIDAVVLGIARALVKYDENKYKSMLREKGYLTVDARTRERRKAGMGGKARRKRQSPKR